MRIQLTTQGMDNLNYLSKKAIEIPCCCQMMLAFSVIGITYCAKMNPSNYWQITYSDSLLANQTLRNPWLQ
jgi:hypothetical protein